ncbi:MAG: biopolymer transporter ExbD [Candidatus Omnitrophota bacterium]|nr:biopolymer transporter ExbD [Candidatus Omnitrophota bacterium]
MIEIKGTKNYLMALESVAMTDIVMNMFIFFFISFSLVYTFNPNIISKLEIRLPKASSGAPLEGSEKTVLAITKSGEYYIDGERIGGSDLKSRLRAKARANPALSVVLKVDGMAKFENVVRALDIINALNIQKVSVAAVKSESKT